jgi:hypothetical protein
LTFRTMAYLERKLKEENSMPLKQERQKVCMIGSPASPVRTVKPGLAEPKFPVVKGAPIATYLKR